MLLEHTALGFRADTGAFLIKLALELQVEVLLRLLQCLLLLAQIQFVGAKRLDIGLLLLKRLLKLLELLGELLLRLLGSSGYRFLNLGLKLLFDFGSERIAHGEDMAASGTCE